MAKAKITAAAFSALINRELPMMAEWGLKVQAIGLGTATLRLPARKMFLRPGNTVSGPVLMGLADVALYAALLGAVGLLPLAVTSNLTINFLRKPGHGSIRAEAKMLKIGRRIAMGEVSLYPGDSHDLAAHVVSSYAIPDAKAAAG